jgi:Right handed beta helix region
VGSPLPALPVKPFTIDVATGDPVSLNGLLIDGGGTGAYGIYVYQGQSVQILNSVVRHFFAMGIFVSPFSNGANLLIEDTIVSDNQVTGIYLANVQATLNRITANNSEVGVETNTTTTIANSVISNNNQSGLANNAGTTWLAKSVISGNATGIVVGTVNSGTVNSYGDNYIRDNGTPVSGSLTPVTTQ